MNNNKLILKISAIVAALSGAVILFSAIYPIISYEATAKRKFPTLLSPVVERKTATATIPQNANNTTTTNTVNGSSAVDYTDPRNWFVGSDYDQTRAPKVAYYTLSIPKLEIDDATVEIGGSDLGKSLIQYPGTAVPGKLGNAVIFGHSILPQFYNPKNYMSIFSLLPTLEKGDTVSVKYDGATYNYRVDTMFEVVPEDIQVLEQQQDSSYLTLVTCVPPGHPLRPKRLVVRAKIIAPGG